VPAPLPPLPPAFRVTDADVRPGGPGMLDLLDDDHERLTRLCDRLCRSITGLPAPLRRRPLVDVLVASLTRHLSAEEQYLYPTVRAVLPGGTRLADQELGEHAAITRTLRRLHAARADDPAYPTLVSTVADHVRRHTRRARSVIFPQLRARCTANELIRLGNRVQIAGEAAPTRPHPSAPVRPPANKLVDPALGVLDKVRDVLTGRRTRFEHVNI
jgi:Hemerythrin HHE cation binding domain